MKVYCFARMGVGVSQIWSDGIWSDGIWSDADSRVATKSHVASCDKVASDGR